jgi:citrate lyase subunit beta/citryl-CoA lyase
VVPPIRSLLFVPVLNGGFVAKAHERLADAVVLDLEDSIAPDRKAEARAALAGAARQLAGHGTPVWVRVNRHDPAALAADLAAAAAAPLTGVILPKVESADEVREAEALLVAAGAPEHLALMADIETAAGLLAAPAIAAASRRLTGLGFGEQDFATDLGVEPIPDALTMPAQQLVIAARSQGLEAIGLVGSSVDFAALDRLAELARASRRIGFTGAACIHPAQVAILNAAFAPDARELAAAQAVVVAFEAGLAVGQGAVALDGKMIDEPIYRRALTVIARARPPASGNQP